MDNEWTVSGYQSAGSRDPIWTRVAEDPNEPNGRHQQAQRMGSIGMENRGRYPAQQILGNKKGLNIVTAAIFIAGEMAGSGVLALPKAVVNCGWIGLILIIFFAICAGIGGTSLGACWEIVEERYPEHREAVRNPYAIIAHKAVGRWMSVLVSCCIQVTLFGAGTVDLLLAAQIFKELFEDSITIGFCSWMVIITVMMCPFAWMRSPKEFSFVGVGALLTTMFACMCIFIQLLQDAKGSTTPVKHDIHNFMDFFLAFGTILFSFGGASTFPTIQNDMVEKNKFSTCVLIGFSAIVLLYLPVATGAYIVYGEAADANIMLTLTPSSFVTAANCLMAIHLIFAFLIVINPVCQELEEICKVPHDFGLKRIILRTAMMVLMLFIGLGVPQFGKILSLIGGSTVTLLTFVFPSIFYMLLCRQTRPGNWPERNLSLHFKTTLWLLILIGLLGAVASTYTAFTNIFGGLTVPCYASWL